MTVFYQHIGEKLWARDAPKSIGTVAEGLKRFDWLDIEPHVRHLDGWEIISLRSKIQELAPTGFQIWGIPSGAERVLRPMVTGDFIMFLESTDFSYVGQVIHRVTQPLPGLSKRIWNEQKFPLIILLQGELISFGWDRFSSAFNFNPKFHMRGQTASLAAARVQQSSFQTEESFIANLLTTTGRRFTDLQTDFSVYGNNLQTHFRQVKARAQQQAFRTRVLELHGGQCAVCSISISSVLDAAHLVPKEHNGTDDVRNGIALCSLHHRMFDAALFAINPITLVVHTVDHFTLGDLHILRPDLSHVKNKPHKDALQWRWDWFVRGRNENESNQSCLA